MNGTTKGVWIFFFGLALSYSVGIVSWKIGYSYGKEAGKREAVDVRFNQELDCFVQDRKRLMADLTEVLKSHRRLSEQRVELETRLIGKDTPLEAKALGQVLDILTAVPNEILRLGEEARAAETKKGMAP